MCYLMHFTFKPCLDLHEHKQKEYYDEVVYIHFKNNDVW